MLDLKGAAAVRINALNEMDMRMLQHAQVQSGLLGRSNSLLELSQASSMPVPSLSGSAMLMGTVAALQEDNGQLRNQWKSDVARLESELCQLRTAAALALPHLAGAQKQQELTLSIPSQGVISPLQQALALQGSSAELSVPLMKTLLADPGAGTVPRLTSRTETAQITEATLMNDRGQLLSRISELERQLQIQKNQVSAAMVSERSSAAAPNPTPGTLQLTEAVLAQMRAESSPRNVERKDQTQNGAFRHHDQQVAGSVLGSTTATEIGMPQEAQIYKELERLEIELQKVREENTSSEAAHARDVSALEAMLDQMMADNRNLTKALSEVALQSSKKGGPAGFDDKIAHSKKCEDVPLTPNSIRSVSEPGLEPDIECSPEFARSKLHVTFGMG